MGEKLWGNRANGIAGDPYKDGSQPSCQVGARIALVEGWGNFTEFKVTNFYYGKSYMQSINGFGFYNSNASGSNPSIERYMENFNVYDTPMSSQRYDDRSWFLHGLFWDLLDNRNEIYIGDFTYSKHRNGNGDPLGNIIDNISFESSNQFNLSSIFNALNSNVEDDCDLRSRLTSNYPNLTTSINQLFISYGYDCGLFQT